MGEGLGLGNQVAISMRGGNNLAGVENGQTTDPRLILRIWCINKTLRMRASILLPLALASALPFELIPLM